MFQPTARNQRVPSDKCVNNRLVRIAFLSFVRDHLALGKPGRFVGEIPIGIDCIGDACVNPALLQQLRVCNPDFIIVTAVPGAVCTKPVPASSVT